MKSINLETFRQININDCIILLKEAESYFLYSNFIDSTYNDDILTSNSLIKSVNEVVLKFHNLSENKYFKLDDAYKVSNFFVDKIQQEISPLKEEIGRGRESGFDQVTNNKVINFNSSVYVEKGVDTFGEKDIMYLEDEDGNKKTISVDDPDHANVVASQIKIKTITKNN